MSSRVRKRQKHAHMHASTRRPMALAAAAIDSAEKSCSNSWSELVKFCPTVDSEVDVSATGIEVLNHSEFCASLGGSVAVVIESCEEPVEVNGADAAAAAAARCEATSAIAFGEATADAVLLDGIGVSIDAGLTAVVTSVSSAASQFVSVNALSCIPSS